MLEEKVFEMMLNYGTLGVMLIYFIWRDVRIFPKLMRIIENNTRVLERVLQKMDDLDYK